jgi:hypothetical protein
MIAYFDESGAHGGQGDVFTLGTFVARDERWRRIEAGWNKALKRRVFHMVDFSHRHGDFEKWPSERARIPLLAQLVDSLRGNVALGVAHSVTFDDFKAIFGRNLSGHRETVRAAYVFLLKSCLEDVLTFIASLPRGEVISVVCEQIKGHEGYITDFFYGYREVEGSGRLGAITFLPKASFRGLQAADMLAYENFKYVTERFTKTDGRPVRKLFEALLSTKRLSAGVYNRERLISVAQVFLEYINAHPELRRDQNG